MYILIDKDNMRIVAKHESCEALFDLAWIEYPHVETSFCSIRNVMFLAGCDESQVQRLYKNTIGRTARFTGHKLRAVMMEAVSRLPETQVDRAELAEQRAAIPEDEKGPYVYVPGSNEAVPAESSETIPLTVDAIVNEDAYAVHGAGIAQYMYPKDPDNVFSPPLPAKPAAQPTARAPRERAATGPAKRPKEGSLTAQVWDIADKLQGQYHDGKQLRRAVIEACTAQGINKSTASVQYGLWASSK